MADLNKEAMSSFTTSVEVKDDAKLVGIQDNDNVNFPIQAVIAKANASQDGKYLRKDEKVPNENLTFGKVEKDNTNVVSGGEVNSIFEIKEGVSTTNILNPEYLKTHRAIESSGNIITTTSVANRIVEKLPIDSYRGQLTISGILEDKLKKIVYHNVDGILVGEARGVFPVPLTSNIPLEAKFVSFSVTRLGSETGWEKVQVNYGDKVLPYEPYNTQYVDSILGHKLITAESYNQSLNTFDDVEFNKVKANIIEYTAYSFNLPKGNGNYPPEVEVGDAWIDTANGNIKVRLN